MTTQSKDKLDLDEVQRRRLQEYLFGLEEIQERAEELAQEHEQLKHTQDLLIAVLSGTTHGICLIKNDKFVWCNQAMTDMLGWDHGELMGKCSAVLYPSPEQHQELTSHIRDRLPQTGRLTFECDFLHRQGRRVPCLVTARALDAHDLNKGHVLSLTDITERRNAEEALRRAHDDLEVKIRERTNELLDANIRLSREIEGRKRAENELRRQNEYLAALHETTLGLISHLDVGELIEAIVTRAAGLIRTSHGFVYLSEDDGESLELKVGIGLCSGSVGFTLKPGEGVAGKVFLSGNPLAVTGYSRWEGRSMDERWAGVQCVVAAPLKSRSRVVGAIGLLDTDTKREFGEEEIQVLGRFADLASIALDNARLYAVLQQELRQRKFTEQALKRSEEKFRSVVTQSTDCIYLADPATKRVVEANPALLHLLGYNHQEIRELFMYDLDDTQQPDEMDRKLHRVLTARDHFMGQRSYRTKNGGTVDVEVTANLISYGTEELLCVACRDTTERKRMEEEIMKADKLESVGLLAGGIAHDFNNILTAVTGNISIAKMRIRPSDSAYTRLDEAEKACSRAKDLTYQLLTFARGGAPIKETASVADVIKESCGFTLSGSNVKCRFEMPDDLWPVEIDTSQVSQVVGNMIVNAKQAMPEGGMISIEARNMVLEEPSGLPLPPGRYIRVSIHDEGTGISEKHLSRIFDPYFTTKQTGSGLGLATSYSIIKKHDGHIHVESQLGLGTTFHIYLPVSEKEVRSDEEAGWTPVDGKGRILLMDDEELIREIVEQMLLHLGYEVVLTSDGAEMLGVYRESLENGKLFDALIMDLTIPGGMGGREAMKAILDMDPSAVGIVSSGYSNDPVMSEFSRYGFKGVMTKPYNIKDLADTLNRILSKKD